MSGIECYLSIFQKDKQQKNVKRIRERDGFCGRRKLRTKVESYSFWKSVAELHQLTSEQSIRHIKDIAYYLERFVSMLLLNNM